MAIGATEKWGEINAVKATKQKKKKKVIFSLVIVVKSLGFDIVKSYIVSNVIQLIRPRKVVYALRLTAYHEWDCKFFCFEVVENHRV